MEGGQVPGCPVLGLDRKSRIGQKSWSKRDKEMEWLMKS
jgi:hypothetical protein